MICPYLKSCQMLQNGIPRVCLCFCSTEQNSESFSPLLKDSERNPESLLLFLLFRTEFRAFFLFRGIPRVCFYFCSTVQSSKHFFLPRNGLERNSERFLFHGTAGMPPEFRRNEPKLFRLFRLPRNNFFVGNFQLYLQYRNLSSPSFGWAAHSGEFFHGTFLFQLRFPTRAF